MSRMIGQKKRKYSQDALEIAVQQIKSHAISISRASRNYGIPKATLHDKINNKYQSSRMGPRRVLSDAEEERIVQWAIHMSRVGYGRTRQELSCVVKNILDADGRKTPFTNNKPGKDWMRAFFKRHPCLSLRSTLQLGKERAIISPEKIHRWFSDFLKYFEEEVKEPGLLNDPSRLYNADESGFALCSTTGKVIGCKGAPVVYHYGNSSKQQLTVMVAASASGHFVPPMIVYPGQRFSYNPLEGFENAAMGRSESGWMDSELFCEWLLSVFIPAVNERGVKKPIVLLLDGHSTHVSLEASNICVENDIELYCLLEHASHIMQPLDLRLFASLKRTWNSAVREFQSENIGELVTKRTFARVFREAWEKSSTIDMAIKGFYEAGLFPICPSRVAQSVKLEPSKLFQPAVISQQNNHKSETVASNSDCDQTLVKKKLEPKVDDQSKFVSLQLRSPSNSSSSVTSQSQTCPISVEITNPLSPNQEIVPESPSNLDTVSKPLPDLSAFLQSPVGLTGTPVSEPSSPTLPITTLQSVIASDSLVCMSTETPSPTSTTQSQPVSPFSKFLKLPNVPEKSSKTKRQIMPKAITGFAYRKLLQDKKEKKEREEREKQKRKEERMKKKVEKQEQLELKKALQLKRKEAKKAMLEKKRLATEKLAEGTQSDSGDDAQSVSADLCYQCETPYNNFMQCENCFRRFHIECIQDQLIGDLPFECKFC